MPAWLWAAVLLPRLIGLGLAWNHPTYSVTSDSRGYIALAENLREEHRFGRDSHAEVTRVPGYPAFLALFVGANYFVVVTLAAQAAMAILAFYIYWVWLREANGSTGAAVAVALWALDPIYALTTLQLMSEPLFCLVSVAAALFTWRALKSRTDTVSLSLGAVAWGVSTLIRPASVFLPALLSPLFLQSRRRFLLFFFLSNLLPGLWIARNHAIAGFPGLSALGGTVLLRYPAASIEAHRTGRPWAETENELRDQVDRQHPSGYASEVERSRAYSALAWSIFRAHPWLLIRVCLEGSVRILFGTSLEMLVDLLKLPLEPPAATSAGITGTGTWHILKTYPALIPIQVLYALGLLVLYGAYLFGIQKLIREGYWLEAVFLVGIPLYFLLIACNQGYYRFRIPMIPFLGAGAAFAFTKCQAKSR